MVLFLLTLYELRHDVMEICILLAHSNAILGTGHLSPEEGAAVIRYAYTQGLRRMVVTHPEWEWTLYPLELQRELARYSVQFERCYFSTLAGGGGVPMATIARAIGEVGPASTVLASNLGQTDTLAPVEGMIDYAARLRAHGFSEADLRQMMVTGPLHLLE